MNITNVDDKIIRETYLKEYNLKDNFDLNDLKATQYLENQKFIDFANYWENDFFKIMDSMNIRRPNIVSRVTDYIQEIFDFVDLIDKKGYIFHDDGSVYFYGTKYNNICDSNGLFSKDPLNPYNFVLLKKANQYSPSWKSPYGGNVRPGWHIECSAMAKSIFGEHYDIHAGGIDLKFPHHHNEMQQSNSILDREKDSKDFVEHFIHQGHLNINGLKMSRSLKNFISVELLSKKYSSNTFRYLFLLHHYADPIDYSEESMINAEYYNEYFKNFFKQIKSFLVNKNCVKCKKFTSYEINLSKQILNAKILIKEELSNNLNTLNAIKIMHDICKSIFIYIKLNSDELISSEILLDAKELIKMHLVSFGIDSFEIESLKLIELVKLVSSIRTNIRDIAKYSSSKDCKTISSCLYNLSDEIRDKKLKELGYELVDT